MAPDNLSELAALIRAERQHLLSHWRQLVRELPSARELDTPTLNDHLPRLLEELVAALEARSEETIPEALERGSSPDHGRQRLRDGYEIDEVVAEYNLLRGCIHDLAEDHGCRLQGKPFHILNRVLDGAIGLAVQTYATAQALEVQRRREEYLAFVAHDLRTPLNAISLSARVLELTFAKQDASAETSRMLHALRRNVQQLDGLVAKVIQENANLATEAGVKLERRTLDVWPLVEALIHDLHPIAGTSSTKLINNVPDALVAYADASLLKRVFQNLIANAIKYTPRGEVVIGARSSDDGATECWVSDNGSGIPSERLDAIFDPSETDPEQGGLGLGLAIVKSFVEAHGGIVTVESHEGVGSTFRFTLPARQ